MITQNHTLNDNDNNIDNILFDYNIQIEITIYKYKNKL